MGYAGVTIRSCGRLVSLLVKCF